MLPGYLSLSLTTTTTNMSYDYLQNTDLNCVHGLFVRRLICTRAFIDRLLWQWGLKYSNLFMFLMKQDDEFLESAAIRPYFDVPFTMLCSFQFWWNSAVVDLEENDSILNTLRGSKFSDWLSDQGFHGYDNWKDSDCWSEQESEAEEDAAAFEFMTEENVNESFQRLFPTAAYQLWCYEGMLEEDELTIQEMEEQADVFFGKGEVY